MDQGVIEKRLTITYFLCIVAGAVSSITPGIAWSHWKDTLNQCAYDRNCSCILYGQHTITTFVGGDASTCIWVTFGPLIYIVLMIGMCIFHGYRVLFTVKKARTRTIMTKDESGETIEVHAIQSETVDPLPTAFWISAATLSVFFTIYALVHFGLFLDGYLATCNQYKRTLEKLLGVHGTVLPVIYGRLSCTAIFDFMDYMQPDTGVGYREGFINTGIDLTLGVIASCLSWLCFLFASFLNIKMARYKG